MSTKLGQIIIISGPTGSGESVITKRILKSFPGTERMVTVTSRPPRPHEQNGVDYHFVSPEKFREMIKNGEFLEHIQVPNREVYYGTLKHPTEDKLQAGINLIGNLGWPGNESYAKLFPGRVLSIFIKPDDLEVIKQRLIKRDPTITAEEVTKRLENAKKEIAEAKYYDRIIINQDGHMEKAVEEIKALINDFLNKQP